MEYSALTPEEREQILQQRKKNFEGEHYNQVLNLEMLEASGSTDPQTLEAIKTAKAAIATIDKAHAHVDAKLKATRPVPPPAKSKA